MSASLYSDSGLHYLFGGNSSWDFGSWKASDDRVRGGKSQSYLEPALPAPQCKPSSNARFHGDLDITTLGNAGFASQRTADNKTWDFSAPEFSDGGLQVLIAAGDGKKYTLVLKDQVLPPGPNGGDQSTLSWEYDFAGEPGVQRIPWADLAPTYRGRPQPDAKPLDLASIKRISIMMRSFFGTQQGAFDLELAYIAAATGTGAAASAPAEEAEGSVPLSTQPTSELRDGSWLGWARSLFRGVL
ncbi:CIA30 family protein [Microdochium nivale]|nr:CIA30 family protein [Microdochium nivale]